VTEQHGGIGQNSTHAIRWWTMAVNWETLDALSANVFNRNTMSTNKMHWFHSANVFDQFRCSAIAKND